MYGGKAGKFYHKRKFVAYLSEQNQFKIDGTHVTMKKLARHSTAYRASTRYAMGVAACRGWGTDPWR